MLLGYEELFKKGDDYMIGVGDSTFYNFTTYGLFEKNPPMAYVYWLGEVCPDRQLFSIIPTAFIKERGNPAMLNNAVLMDFVPWPRCHHWSASAKDNIKVTLFWPCHDVVIPHYSNNGSILIQSW